MTVPLRVTDTHCLRCGPSPFRVVADRLIRTLPENIHFGGRLKIVQCATCGLRYLNPAPDVRDLPQIYQYEVWGDSTNANPVLMDHFYGQMQAHTSRLRRVIEIGCGTGDFLAWLEARGLQCDGNEFAASAQKQKFAGQMYYGRIEDVTVPHTYDAVLLLNVIEHLSDPRAALAKIRAMLTEDGVLLVRHPNADLFNFAPYLWTVELAKYAYHRLLLWRGRRTRFTIAGFQNQHLFYFDRRQTTRLLEDAGFEVVRVSTVDPYNYLRFVRGVTKGRPVDAGIAGVRHALSFVGLGTECLFVAKPRHEAAS